MRRLRRPVGPAGAPPDPGWLLRTGVHEEPGTPVPANDSPVGAVRLMTQDQSQVNGRADRARALWQQSRASTTGSDVWPFMCLKTHWTTETTGPSSLAAQGGVESPSRQFYETRVRQAITRMDGTSGVTRGEIFEVGNEPNDNAGIDRMLRAIAGSYQTIRDSGRKVVCGYALGPGLGRILDRLFQAKPLPATGDAAPWMVDGFALHSYNHDPAAIIAHATNFRDKLDARGLDDIPIYITENGWPQDRHGNYNPGANPLTNWIDYTSAQQRDKLTAMYDQLVIHGANLLVAYWCWFSYGDMNPGLANGFNHCGLVEMDTRGINLSNPTWQGWASHSPAYDGRAKGGTSPGTPPPYVGALLAMRNKPRETYL